MTNADKHRMSYIKSQMKFKVLYDSKMQNRAERVSYLDLTGCDQIVGVIESFLYCRAYTHQAMIPQDEHLGEHFF